MIASRYLQPVLQESFASKGGFKRKKKLGTSQKTNFSNLSIQRKQTFCLLA